jgi:hypothetical protein
LYLARPVLGLLYLLCACIAVTLSFFPRDVLGETETQFVTLLGQRETVTLLGQRERVTLLGQRHSK